MLSFFRSTYYFWVVSRAIIILLGTINLFTIFSKGRLTNLEQWVNFSFFIYLLLNSFVFVNEITRGHTNKPIKIITGLYAILTGIGVMIAIVITGNSSYPPLEVLGMFFSIWLILLGIFDLAFRIRTEA